MSLIYEHKEGCIISHSDYINKIYQNTYLNNSQTVCNFTIQYDLFEIKHPFKISSHETICESVQNVKSRKRKHKTINLDPETLEIKERFESLVQSAKSCKIITDSCIDKDEASDSDNKAAREMADLCSSMSLCLRGMERCNGGNTSSFPLLQTLKSCGVLLPANCRFLCGDVRNTLCKLEGELFDLIVLDPPWWNKYIRRSKAKRPESSYDMLYNSEVADLPVGSLLSDDGVIAVWCTNCVAHEKDIKELMFKRWNVQYRATWYWMKITKSGIPLCPFTESTGKKPYERLIIGTRNIETTSVDGRKEFPEKRLIVSVPSALHSHKPPLNDILSPYLSTASPQCLEIFARYLLPNTTSVGLEPLRWQHSQLFKREINRL